VRDQILSEIRRLAEANGGQPPGRGFFEAKTGIGRAAWLGKYWARWGDAVAEAGFAPNEAPSRLQEEFILRKLVEMCRRYGKAPTVAEMRMYKRTDPDCPHQSSILRHFDGMPNLLRRLGEWVRQDQQYTDVAAMLTDVSSGEVRDIPPSKEGFVYLIKSGAHYKIGRSDELERRVKEIRIALPEAATLVHSIRTDDPSGIEAYWHRRFADRQANGEWFKLSNADVAAFKKRKFQ
jgi:hypothetical protein